MGVLGVGVFRPILVIGLLAVASMGLSACGQSKKGKKGPGYVTTCQLPDDQANTLQGKWSTTPVKVTFHEGDFGAADKQAFATAGETWNSFFTASKGANILNVSTEEVSLSQVSPNCSTGGTISEGTVVYKRTTWTRLASQVAVTSFCTAVGSDPIPQIYNAIIEMNYVDFWNGQQTPDMQSIALHELGHLIGLDHSCGPLRSGANNVACPDSSSGHWLLDTVMFPTVFFDPSGNGEIKTSLHSNDQGRANCLY